MRSAPDDRDPGSRRWAVVRVDLPRRLADEAAGWLGPGTLGVEVVDSGADRSTVRVYVEREEDAEQKREEAVRVLRGAPGIDPGRFSVRVDTVEDGRWVERYQASLRPMPVGARFWLSRAGGAAPEEGPEGRAAIRLVPGRAFGTGEHPTTGLCVRALETWVRPGSLWTDLGTGSGILAVVAAKLGAAGVLAVDHDPGAVEVAADTVVANDVAGTVVVRRGSVDAAARRPADGVVANVDARFFAAHGAGVAAAVRPGGILVASGFLADEALAVSTGLEGVGFRPAGRSADEGWACLTLGRGPRA